MGVSRCMGAFIFLRTRLSGKALVDFTDEVLINTFLVLHSESGRGQQCGFPIGAYTGAQELG